MHTTATPREITQLLAAWRGGDSNALTRLTPLVYDELRRLATRYLAGEKAGHILQPSALVNEAFLRLLEWKPDEWKSRAQFFGVSANLMRRILVQYAREQGAMKRGAGQLRVSLSEAVGVEEAKNAELIAVDYALSRLEQLDPRQARIVELRFFGGLTLEEAAEVMEVSVSTVRRDFRIARAWFRQELSGTAQ